MPENVTTPRSGPVPVEETVKKVRRFAPQPVETTTRSSKKEKTQDANANANTNGSSPDKPSAGKRRFLPTPVETSTRSNKQRPGNKLPTPEPIPTLNSESPPPPDTPKPRQKLAPELIETTKRSKKAGDARPATLPTDKTDLTPGVPNIYISRPKRARDHHEDAASSSGFHHIPPTAPRRQGSMKPHLNTRRSTRRDSFQPGLDDILSSGENSDGDKVTGEDTPPSLSHSLESSEESLTRIQLARTRESCDDRFAGYLLSLAAKAAEKQLRELREQEDLLAAFPNESAHEIVEHFYGGESDEESVEGTGMLGNGDPDPLTSTARRRSTDGPGGWDLKEMRFHQDSIDKLREAAREKLNRMKEVETNKKLAAEASNPSFKDPFWTNGQNDKDSPFYNPAQSTDAPREAELKAMRSAASPPMLGAEIVFRMCQSPKATKFESDQKIDAMPNRCSNGGGLWGGYCVAEDSGEFIIPFAERGPNLIETPTVEHDDPFFPSDLPVLPPGSKTPRSRESGVRMLAGIDDRLKAEIARSKEREALLEEFDDNFVSQVYNYLSLGYPALARQFDEELAKISHVPEAELKMDDSKRNAKGYIGISVSTLENDGPKSPTKKHDDHKDYCARWKALRMYILKWALQHPNISQTGSPDWGVRARRGSWAI